METKVKICDIRDVITASFCANNGVDFIGLHQIYAPITEKNIVLFNEIKSVSKSLKLVLVTREENLNKLLDMCLSFEFDYIQMHFPISLLKIKKFKVRLKRRKCNTGLIAVVSSENIDNIDIHALSKVVDYILFDTSFHGGTGVCSSIQTINKIINKAIGTKFFFAGGLNSSNVAQKIMLLNPFAVDVQSGVEVEGGKHIKDLSKILEFVKASKNLD